MSKPTHHGNPPSSSPAVGARTPPWPCCGLPPAWPDYCNPWPSLCCCPPPRSRAASERIISTARSSRVSALASSARGAPCSAAVGVRGGAPRVLGLARALALDDRVVVRLGDRRGAAAVTDGIVGARINHVTNVTVSNFRLVQQ